MFIRVIFAFFLFTGLANAQAIWVDYAWEVKPAQEARFMQAVNKFTGSSAFQSFPGRMIFNAHAANGTQPTTHSFAVVYKDMASFEAFSASLAGNKDWDSFRRALNAAGSPVSETVYAHVAGWGDMKIANRAWQGWALQVRNPQAYAGGLKTLMQNPTMGKMPGSMDLWQVVAGGTPGVTHVIVYGSDTWAAMEGFRRDIAADRQIASAIAEFSKVRTMLGTTLLRGVKDWGSYAMR